MLSGPLTSEPSIVDVDRGIDETGSGFEIAPWGS
jgi:hypothetical protein